MPSLTTWAAFCPCGQCYPRDQNKHKAAPVKVTRQQTTREPSGTFATLQLRGRNLPPILPPQPTHTRRNSPPPEPSKTFCANLRQHTPEPSKIFRSLPEPASGTYTSIRRNFQEPSGTCLTPELSGTFRNPPPEPTPAYAETFRNLPEPPAEPTAAHHRTLWNLPEPSSGTCSCDPHRHTPELIWAEDPISLRCWGIIFKKILLILYFYFCLIFPLVSRYFSAIFFFKFFYPNLRSTLTSNINKIQHITTNLFYTEKFIL